MRIDEILKHKRTLSFEVFPPKKGGEGKEKLLATIDELAGLRPDFISVTYGAGGSNSKNTLEIADYIQNSAHVNALAHITGGPSSPETVDELARTLQEGALKMSCVCAGISPSGTKRNTANISRMRQISPNILRPITSRWVRRATRRVTSSARRCMPTSSI